MSSSIYDIVSWGKNTYYVKNTIVLNDSKYYYAGYTHTSHISQDFTPALAENPGLWLGRGVDSYGIDKPQFSWSPSYAGTFDNAPRVKVIKFGDGYEQRAKDGISSVLLNLDLVFDNRDINECSAIEHFLNAREATESFLFTPPPPYSKKKRFVCRTWQNSNVFYNNFAIKVKFEEVSN